MDKAIVTIKDLLEAGVHFGHKTAVWNPKMERFIFGKRNGVHIIDLEKTLERIEIAYQATRSIAESGKDILFCATKHQAKDVIREEAEKCGAFYVNERWVGGLLTNFSVISPRLLRLAELERILKEDPLSSFSKKEIVKMKREYSKLQRIFWGVKDMERLPGLIYIVDIVKEKTALLEARRLKIPVVAIVDTNADPELVDYPIPGNDDAMKSIRLITSIIAQAVAEGRKVLETQEEE